MKNKIVEFMDNGNRIERRRGRNTNTNKMKMHQQLQKTKSTEYKYILTEKYFLCSTS